MNALCRCCLAGENSSLYPLSSILIANANLTILEVLGTVASCKVNESKTLPNNICPRCLKSLKKAFNFITLFEDTQMRLVNMLAQKEEEVVELSSDEETVGKNIIKCEDDNIMKKEKICDSGKDKAIVISDEELENNLNPNIIFMTIDDVLRIDREEKWFRENGLPSGSTPVKPSIGIKEESTSDSTKQLLDHKRRTHNSNSHMKFQCRKCGVRCRTQSAFLHHMGKHGPTHFECYLCGHKYVVKEKLAFHIKIRHQSHANKKIVCSICGRNVQSNSLQDHMKIYHNQRDFICSYCPFTTVSPRSLKYHERTHTGEYGGKTSVSPSGRTKHENIHSGIKNFECQYCHKNFGTSESLKNHQMTHTGNLICYICSRSFPEDGILMRHLKFAHM